MLPVLPRWASMASSKSGRGSVTPSPRRAFQFPDGSIVTSANITPDKETGIGSWTKEAFVQRFKTYADSTYVGEPVAVGEFNSVMPWMMYGQMNEEDLTAIYTYLKTVAPISNSVVKFKAAR